MLFDGVKIKLIAEKAVCSWWRNCFE